MRAKLWIAVGLAVVVGLSVWWIHGGVGNLRGSAATLASSSHAAVRTAAVPKQASARTSALYRVHAPHEPTEKPKQRGASPYICETCKPSPFVATSEAEAAWMRSTGFPTPQMHRELNALGMDELKAKADGGNLAAMAIYGVRVAKSGNSGLGTAYLVRAALHGSIYACYGLSKVDLLPGPFLDRFAAASDIRLAMLLGDSKASDYLYRQFPDFGPHDFVAIDRDASVLLHRLMAREYVVFGSYNVIMLRPMDYDNDGSADKPASH